MSYLHLIEIRLKVGELVKVPDLCPIMQGHSSGFRSELLVFRNNLPLVLVLC